VVVVLVEWMTRGWAVVVVLVEWFTRGAYSFVRNIFLSA
jgi:hypothetical protein